MSKDTTHTNEGLSEAYKEMMERTGFYRDGRPTTGVIEATTLRENSNGLLDKRIKYSAVIDSTKLNADAIFELSGSPCIYFTSLSQAEPDPAELAQLYKTAWNQGLAPMLWISTPTKVLLYNCYSKKPAPDDENHSKRHLIELFEQTEIGLRQLNDFAGRLQLESGRFWQHEKARQIDRRQRVDAALLADLREAEHLLMKEKLEPKVAHALLGRSIFVAYLHDRGVLDSSFFREHFNVENFVELLSSEFAESATYEVFEWVRKTFNGDLFPLEHKDEDGHVIHEQDLVNKTHLAKVGDLLAGVEMRTGQGRLWPYKFDVIPIELISSIYEMFIHSSNTQIARERSTYYTPINLVDLVLSEVFKQLHADANVLDLSCGSGVFLVESLRRLVARRVASGEEWSRELVRDTLYKQIYGVDISSEAVRIAAFSLYLTALELDPDMQSLDKIQFQHLRGKNLFDADAFDESASFNQKEPFAIKNFQAIVGNPPWRRKIANSLAEKYCKKRGYPITRRSLDQPFLWRIADFTNEKTLIGLILHSNPLFSHMPEALEARMKLLTRLNPLVIVNLSALRQDGLFPKSDAPATVLIAEGGHSQINGCFYLVCAEHSESFKRHGIIEIGPENIKKISIQHVISDTDVLKIASWGNARDMALIARLRATFPPLRSLVKEPRSIRRRNDEWLGGQGFQEAGGSQKAPKLIGKKWLPSGEMQPYLLEPEGLEEISPEQRFHRPRDPRIYEAPLVITTRGLGVNGFFSAFCLTDVVYTEEYYGISVPRHQEYFAHYLNGVLNSSLISYFLFLTASVWGVERDKIEPNDLLRLPLPTFIQDDNGHIVSLVVRLEERLRLTQNQAIRAEIKEQLDKAVFDLYDLSEVERILVQDTLNFTIDLRMKGETSKALDRPENEELKAYSLQLINTIQPFFRTLNEVMMEADIFETKTAPLQLIKFSVVPVPGRIPSIQVIAEQALDDVLGRIATQLPTRIAETIYTRRNLRIYEGNDYYIVKPSQRRYWSCSAALNDADTIISEQMKGNYASIR